jgi:uncharacterized protein
MPYDIVVGRDDADKKLFGKKGLVKIGKGYVHMGRYTSLSNPIYLDVNRSHVILVAGKRGSGKSYTLGVVAEEISDLPVGVKENIAPLIFDTMGIFWTMKHSNEKDVLLLGEWGLKPKKLPMKVFVPFGKAKIYESKGIPVDSAFSIKVSEMKAEDWILMFGLNIVDSVSVLIERTLYYLDSLNKEYSIEDIMETVKNVKGVGEDDKNAVIGLFEAAKTWGVFATSEEKGTDIDDLINPGETSVIDLSVYSSVGAFNVRAMVIGLLSRKLFNKRMLARKIEEVEAVRHGANYLSYQSKRKTPLVWIFIDEAHEFLPKEGKTLATDSLVQILREGRQPGISLVLATQQPGEIHKDVMTQSDIVISHRLTAEPDLKALNTIMQSYLFEGIKKSIDDLPNLKGSAVILDDNSERLYPMRVRPRFTWHGGEAPTSVKAEKEF